MFKPINYIPLLGIFLVPKSRIEEFEKSVDLFKKWVWFQSYHFFWCVLAIVIILLLV